jgi:hypothetical protein
MQMMLEQAGDLLHLILLNNWVLPPTHSYQELGGNLQFIVRNFVILRELTLASYSIQFQTTLAQSVPMARYCVGFLLEEVRHLLPSREAVGGSYHLKLQTKAADTQVRERGRDQI